MKIQNTLNVWKTVRKKRRGPSLITRALTTAGETDFCPSLCDAGFRRWADN